MYLRKLLRGFLNLFRLNKKSSDEYYKLMIVSELPEIPDDKVVYIEGSEKLNNYWYAFLKCPCGCNENIMLNLMNDAKPCWSISIKKGNFSISPSVWRTVNCKSHFWLRNGKIVWA